MNRPHPVKGNRRHRQWRPGEILRFRADAALRPENLTLRLTHVLVIEPAAWVDDGIGSNYEWRQLVRSLVRHEDGHVRPEDLEPLPPHEAAGLLTIVKGRLRLQRRPIEPVADPKVCLDVCDTDSAVTPRHLEDPHSGPLTTSERKDRIIYG